MGRQGIKRRKKRNIHHVSPRSIPVRYIRRNLSWFSYGLVGFLVLSSIAMLCMCLTGCGHTITHTDIGTGVIAKDEK